MQSGEWRMVSGEWISAEPFAIRHSPFAR